MPEEVTDRSTVGTIRVSRVEHDISAMGPQNPAVHLAWFAAVCVLAFAIPYVLSDRLRLPVDMYYLAYFAAVGGAMVAYVKTTRVDWIRPFRRAWLPSLVLGLLAAAFLVRNVLTDPATPGPAGPALAFALLWRGLTYGLVDAILLTAFPVLVATGLFRNRLGGIARRVGFAAVVLALSLVVTLAYHAGYAQFRDHGWARNGLGGPVIGNTVISLPAALSTNPVGSLLAHVAMYVTAVAHVYETDVFLPPRSRAPQPR